MANVCIIEGCTTEVSVTVHTSICHDHWRALPIELRKRWWKETGFGRRDPSLELISRINKTLAVNYAEPDVFPEQQVDYEKIGHEIPVVTTRDPNFPNYVKPKVKGQKANYPTLEERMLQGKAAPGSETDASKYYDEIGKLQAGAPSPIGGKR